MTVQFSQFVHTLQKVLLSAQHSIHIAVSWFTHRGLFELLLKKRTEGVQVTVILEYDNQNFKPNGIDWAVFLKAGGVLHANRQTALMHHKFAIVDGKILLAGTFNWTHAQNNEHLFYITDDMLISYFKTEWNHLLKEIPALSAIHFFQVKNLAYYPTFENTHIQKGTLRQMVAGGARIWAIKTSRKERMDATAFFLQQRLYYDANGTLQGFWASYRIWRADWFRQWLEESKNERSTHRANQVKRWMLRMKAGDLVLLVAPDQKMQGLGVIRSEPMACTEQGYSTFREVQWVHFFQDTLLPIPINPFNGGCTLYKGSSFELLEKMV